MHGLRRFIPPQLGPHSPTMGYSMPLIVSWHCDPKQMRFVMVSFTPAVVLDLDSASNAAMVSTINEFKAKFRDVERPKLDLSTGWHTITPQIAENLLRCTGDNRKVSVQTVQYYARQMQAGQWQKTGQPIIITESGEMIDAQHRCWAGYLSNTPFESFVVTGVPVIENLFAYIDNGKARSAADALSTAGLNGLSGSIAGAVRIARYYDAGALTMLKKEHVNKPSPMDVLSYVTAHPELRSAAHLQIGEYKAATKIIGYRDVAVFFAWKVLETSSEDELDDFMGKLGGTEPVDDASPVGLLRKKLNDNASSTDPMPKHHTLAYLTKVFNAVRLGLPMRRLNLKTDEAWPLFADEDVVEAAE